VAEMRANDVTCKVPVAHEPILTKINKNLSVHSPEEAKESGKKESKKGSAT
jgi:hypothetical protein